MPDSKANPLIQDGAPKPDKPGSDSQSSPGTLERGSKDARLRETLFRWLRRDWLAILLFVAAVVVMTYPLALHLGELLPSKEMDTLAAYWQVWWLGEAVKSGHNANFSPFLFHPNGLDVTFQPHPWTALGTWRLLTSLFGDMAGYSLNAMLGLLVSGYATYLLIHTLTDNRAAAWVGGAFYAFYPQHLVRALQQPTTGSIQWYPVFMLTLVVGLRRFSASPERRQDSSTHSLAMMVLAALALSINAYISIKPWMQAALLGALYVPLAALTEGWWRQVAFWKALTLLAICSLLLVLPVLSPFLMAGPALQSAVEKTTDDLIKGADLLAYVKAALELPIFTPRSLAGLLGIHFSKHPGRTFYLGLLSILLVIAGLADPVRRNRQRVVWLVLALVFWSLSLGTVLWIDTVEHPDVWTPYRLVENISAFQAFRVPFRFALGFSLPWAVLVGYGVGHVWRRLASRKWLARSVTGGLAMLMLFELAIVPIDLRPVGVSPFYYQLCAAEKPGAIIDLPMGTQPSKRYMYLQTIHHRPIVEGKIARMPKGAYDYINANPLLEAWRRKKEPTCDYDIGRAIDKLQADGFRYVIYHKLILPRYRHPNPLPDWLGAYFATVEPIYEDGYVTVYELSDLEARPPCAP